MQILVSQGFLLWRTWMCWLITPQVTHSGCMSTDSDPYFHLQGFLPACQQVFGQTGISKYRATQGKVCIYILLLFYYFLACCTTYILYWDIETTLFGIRIKQRFIMNSVKYYIYSHSPAWTEIRWLQKNEREHTSRLIGTLKQHHLTLKSSPSSQEMSKNSLRFNTLFSCPA